MKSRPDLLPPLALLEAGIVMSMNEEKHPNQRWKTMTSEEHIGAILRHILAWISGNRFDPETGKSHLVHAMCRSAMAAEQEMCPPDTLESTTLNHPVSTLYSIDNLLAEATDQNRHDLIDAGERSAENVSYEPQTGDRVTQGIREGSVVFTSEFYVNHPWVKWDGSLNNGEPVDKTSLRLISRPEWESYVDGILSIEQCPVKGGKEIDAYTEKEWDEARL